MLSVDLQDDPGCFILLVAGAPTPATAVQPGPPTTKVVGDQGSERAKEFSISEQSLIYSLTLGEGPPGVRSGPTRSLNPKWDSSLVPIGGEGLHGGDRLGAGCQHD